MLRREGEVGPYTTAPIQTILSSRRHPEQAYRACLGILRLAGRYARPQIELAAQPALEAGLLRYREVKALLEYTRPKQ